MKARTLYYSGLIALISMLLVGCPLPIIPGDSGDSRQNIGDVVPDFIIRGRTTKADVLLALGEPDVVSEHGEWIVYLRKTSKGGVLFLVGGAGHVGGSSVEGMTYRRLTIHFDDLDVVTNASHVIASCSQRELLIEHSGHPLRSPPCASLTGENTLLDTAPSAVCQSGEEIQGQQFPSASMLPRLCGFQEIRAFRLEPPETTGNLIVGSTSIYFVSPNADSKSKPLLKLDYVEIADVYVDTFGLGRRLAIKRTNGECESFEITHGIWNDSKLTESTGALVISRWRAATAK
jgi:outer membrane protein assembly factor BamE (lipoprotein component of BamABCDE complex)